MLEDYFKTTIRRKKTLNKGKINLLLHFQVLRTYKKTSLAGSATLGDTNWARLTHKLIRCSRLRCQGINPIWNIWSDVKILRCLRRGGHRTYLLWVGAKTYTWWGGHHTHFVAGGTIGVGTRHTIDRKQRMHWAGWMGGWVFPAA